MTEPNPPAPGVDPVLPLVQAAIAESKRLRRGDFDGLTGTLDRDGNENILLRRILGYLRDYLLDWCKGDATKARHLLATFGPRSGFHAMPVIPRDVEAVLDLLCMFPTATNCTPERFAALVLGPARIRDKGRQAGAHDGGAATGKQRANAATARYADWQREAVALERNGKAPRNVAAILAKRHGVAASTIRRGLNKARTR